MKSGRPNRLVRHHGIKEGANRRTSSPLLETVRLQAIDRSDELFCMNFEPDLGLLRASVKEMGILEPIWLRRKGRKLQIVSGFRRFDVAAALGTQEVRALTWREDELADRHAFEMGLHENILTRGLSLVERALVLEKLVSCFAVTRDKAIQTYLPLLGLDPHEHVLDSHLVVNSFSVDLKRYCLSHGLSMGNMMLLGRFSGDERESIRRFLSPLRIGENVLREFLTVLGEISRRDGIGIENLLSGPEFQRGLADSRLSGPQRIQSIRRLLKKRRYPELSALEERFSSWKNKVGLSPGLAIRPPPFFEGNRFKIEICFESVEEYEAILVQLENLSKGPIRHLLTIKGYGSDPN